MKRAYIAYPPDGALSRRASLRCCCHPEHKMPPEGMLQRFTIEGKSHFLAKAHKVIQSQNFRLELSHQFGISTDFAQECVGGAKGIHPFLPHFLHVDPPCQ
ncbi:MAG: hypothetical protein ABI240_05925 [Sphingomonas sp.]